MKKFFPLSSQLCGGNYDSGVGEVLSLKEFNYGSGFSAARKAGDVDEFNSSVGWGNVASEIKG